MTNKIQRGHRVKALTLCLGISLSSLLLFAPVLHSAPTATSATELNADVITYTAQTGVMTAQGGVRMTQGSTVLTGNAGEYNTKNKTAVITGNVKVVKEGSTLTAAEVQAVDDMKWFIASGGVLLVNPQGTAAGPRLEYSPERQYAKITGGATLTNQEARITASVVEAFFNENRAIADGSVRIVSDSRKLDAVADHLVYFGDQDKKGRAELTGNVRAVQEGTVLTGNHVILYLDDSAMDANGRPSLVITPQQKVEKQ